MHTATFTRAIAFSCLIAISSPAAQEPTLSLGELARRERERKNTQAQTSDLIKEQKLLPQEEKAYRQANSTAADERACKASLGRYAVWEQLLTGCRAQGATAATERKDDPRRDPDYDYRLTASDDAFEFAAAPRRPGLGGFLTDGQKIYFNPQGAATRESKMIYDFASSAPAGTAGHSKKVYTEDDLQRGGQTNAGGGGSSSEGSAAPGNDMPAEGAQTQAGDAIKDLKLSPDEEKAYLQLGFIAIDELLCKEGLGRYADWEQLFTGCRAHGVTGAIDRRDDPRRDPDYDYGLSVSDDAFELSAAPRRSGLGGFFTDRHKIYFDSQGAATRESKLIYTFPSR